MKLPTQKLFFFIFAFGFIYLFSPEFSNHSYTFYKALSQTSFKDYKLPGKFSFRYPQSWTVVEDILKNDGTKTILFSKSGASKELPLLGTVSVRVTLTNLYYRTSVNMGQPPTFENRLNVFMNTPNSSGLSVTGKGNISGRKYVRMEGSQNQGYYVLKNSNYFIGYSEKSDLVIETAIVNQVSVGNKKTFTLDNDSYLKSVKEVGAFVSSFKIP